MTVSTDLNRKQYAGNGVTTSFATSPVVFFDSTDLDVYVVTTATGAATLLTETTDYTVTGGAGSTGTVSTAGLYGAPSASQTLVIVRNVPLTQATDFVQNDASDAEVVEDAFDKLTMADQQLSARLTRSFTLADSDVSGASLTVPTPSANKLVGWNSAGTALENKTAADIDLATVTAFIETLLDDADAAAARTTLGIDGSSKVIATGDLADGGVTFPKLGTSAMAAGFALLNGYLSWSVSGNALTVAVKTLAGADPSASDPVYIVFRNSTAATGSPVFRALTAATSVTVPDTAFVGTANSTAFRLWCVAFDDGGTVRLAVINCVQITANSGSGYNVTGIYPLSGWGIASSTQVGTGSDSWGAFYSSGASVASQAYSTLGYATWESGLAAAGTWSAGPTRVQLWAHGSPLPGQVVQQTFTQTTGVVNGTTALPMDDTIPQSGEGVQMMTLAITPTSAANALASENVAYLSQNSGSEEYMAVALFRDAIANAIAAIAGYQVRDGTGVTQPINLTFLAGSTSATTLKIRAGSNGATTITLNGTGSSRRFGGVAASSMKLTELMG